MEPGGMVMTSLPVFIEAIPPEVFTCGVETRAASWYVDPEPAEYCENEVENEGGRCPKHDGCGGCTSRWCEDCNG